jgi:hypothetical protein
MPFSARHFLNLDDPQASLSGALLRSVTKPPKEMLALQITPALRVEVAGRNNRDEDSRFVERTF